MNFITRFIFHQQHNGDSSWFTLKRKWDKLCHFKKCSCGHPLWMHQCYEHGTCIHGVCLAETFMWEKVTCCCQGFNDMWNKEYPPDQPELRKEKK